MTIEPTIAPTQDMSIRTVAQTWPSGPVTERTVRRWMLDGYPASPEPIRLRSKRVGGRRVTTAEWHAEFVAKITVLND